MLVAIVFEGDWEEKRVAGVFSSPEIAGSLRDALQKQADESMEYPFSYSMECFELDKAIITPRGGAFGTGHPRK